EVSSGGRPYTSVNPHFGEQVNQSSYSRSLRRQFASLNSGAQIPSRLPLRTRHHGQTARNEQQPSTQLALPVDRTGVGSHSRWPGRALSCSEKRLARRIRVDSERSLTPPHGGYGSPPIILDACRAPMASLVTSSWRSRVLGCQSCARP